MIAVLAGLVLVVGGGWALIQERRDEIAECSALPVYMSGATGCVRKLPQWIFLGTATVWAPLAFTIISWQAEALSNSPEMHGKIDQQVYVCGVGFALGGYLYAMLPVGTLMGKAGIFSIFAAFGCRYVALLPAAFHGKVLSDVMVPVLILLNVVANGAMISMFCNMAGIFCRGKATGVECWRMEAVLGASQVLCALAIAAGIICGGVLLLDFESNSYTPIIAGSVFFVATLTLDGILYYVGSRDCARAASETELVLA